jgi:hypothetical protein
VERGHGVLGERRLVAPVPDVLRQPGFAGARLGGAYRAREGRLWHGNGGQRPFGT